MALTPPPHLGRAAGEGVAVFGGADGVVGEHPGVDEVVEDPKAAEAIVGPDLVRPEFRIGDRVRSCGQDGPPDCEPQLPAVSNNW